MTDGLLFSDDARPFDWSEAGPHKLEYGPKGAMLATLPRLWTPPFMLIPASLLAETAQRAQKSISLGEACIARLKKLAAQTGDLIIRSSVIGETIWDRGKYKSIVVSANVRDFEHKLSEAVDHVIASSPNNRAALVIQSYVSPVSHGQFGNLLRVSKTRDHWELSTESSDGATSRTRFNTQRDEAASPADGLEVRARVPRERLFGSIAAWLNNNLLRGRSQRLTCEWLTDNRRIYLVQIDEEDEDFLGVNPFQIRIEPAHRPRAASGSYLQPANDTAVRDWDKLKVLDELWEQGASHKPTLFFVPLSALHDSPKRQASKRLEEDFRSLIGPDNIVVRTSVRAGHEKSANLPRTEGLRPDRAAAWCLAKCNEFRTDGWDLGPLAFVAHRFIAARASAWVRAEPGNPIVEIHGLWGLPDALQYCAYDIWEVHVPTETATDYPEYKSHMLLARDDGEWEYVRVKNELARSLCITRREAIDLATRSNSIAQRIGQPCHIMWFVGCVDDDGVRYSLPWYWTRAHEAEKNVDRSNYKVVTIHDRHSLDEFRPKTGDRSRLAVELRPTDLGLMRDNKFIQAVGLTAKQFELPVMLAGSTLAHAYYQLCSLGCMVIPLGEKEHTRVRRSTSLGKLVRDKVITKIVQRQEAEITKKIPTELVKSFLISKILEEALEVRNAEGQKQKTIELADLYEVLRALANLEGIALREIVATADEKKRQSGGFDEGLVLLQTGILGRSRSPMQDLDRPPTQVLARRISTNSYEIPFTFFGFMEFDQNRSLVFEDLGVRLDILLKIDRIEIHLSTLPEQLELPLDLSL